ncbi:pleckstrin homology-like domain family B member 1 isoform X2 [Schistocerca serialis cubense]|uniref:pleckstrin homology-like domain family B member 1 isoform X2 n=1 Tax=Schistocerca serialis cubense TaxID=2023355 RepID=UPI00214E066E|nr:pleckstrin homology-like domain family B member 1 isoform X2 [Schistocerca serialis cubense]
MSAGVAGQPQQQQQQQQQPPPPCDAGLEVREAGRALKVHAELPHLVSLGGGRLSTAVTLHPLPPGRVSLGSDPSMDIVVQGTGVEPVHCHIENNAGVVTLFPLASMTAVDGLQAFTPTRLTQGSMICIGRSNYLRFNHPAEARLMKSILPNTRISMVPLSFLSGTDTDDSNQHSQQMQFDKKPPVAPRRSPRDSWGDVSNSSSCTSEDCCVLGKVSKFEYLARANGASKPPPSPASGLQQSQHISPKVFPPNSVTVNSPASALLGPNVKSRSATPTNPNYSNPSAFNSTHSGNSSAFSNIQANNVAAGHSGIPTAMINGGSRSQSATPTPSWTPRSGAGPHAGSPSAYENVNPQAESHRSIATPSPAFNRNPLPWYKGGYHSPRSVTPSPPRASTTSPLSSGHRRTSSAGGNSYEMMRHRVNSPTPSFGSSCSIEDLHARKEELEIKRKQAQEERLREQEVEKAERARLEEILNMCAEYERQAQSERQAKLPTTPTLQQNRIKTNGSLPRDKRLTSPGNPPNGTMPDDYGPDVFTFDVTNNIITGFSSVNSPSSPYNNSNPNYVANDPQMCTSTSTPVTSCMPNKRTTPANGNTFSPYENVVIPSPGSVVYPQSPRTRIKTIATTKDHNISREMEDTAENRLALSNDYDFVSSLSQIQNYQNGTVPQTANQAEANSKIMSSNIEEGQKPFERDKFILPLENGCSDSSPADSVDMHVHKEQPNFSNQNGEARDNVSEMEKNMSLDNKTDIPRTDRSSSHAFTQFNQRNNEADRTEKESQIQQQRRTTKDEGDALRKERSKLLASMSGIKRKITEIEQQEEELLRELELERALLDGEQQSQTEKLLQEEDRLVAVESRMVELDHIMERTQEEELKRQAECQRRLDEIDREVRRLNDEATVCTDIERHKELSEKLKQQHDLLDSERKMFEDMEFHHLEEEASCLARREELQRELTEVYTRIEARRCRMRELDQQRLEADRAAQDEGDQLEQQLLQHLRLLDEGRSRLRAIELRLEELARQGIVSSPESSPDASSDVEESDGAGQPNGMQSQEDLDRISRVTSRAPMDLATGSLGRRTIASLQEIERNRHLHLAQQGSMVIEEERKRVQELKRRVQDEVRAQWEERRQREMNCNSLNSVGSDETSLTSSDVPTESASSDDALEKRTAVTATEVSGSGTNVEPAEAKQADSTHETQNDQKEVREKELGLERDLEESRPLSDGSSYEHQLAVRMRDKATKLQQRPLTRYLPIRSESLNLRAHIESAGHQIELCPHVILDATSCRGPLHKMGSKFHHWNKRWFVFDRVKRTLMYYGDRSEKKPRGGTYFQSIEEVYVDHMNSVKSPSPHLTFVVKTHERTYYLMAPSPEAMRIWVDVIFTGAEGYQEFEHGS